MGFTKLYIPDIKTLQEELLEKGNQRFYKDWSRRYVKADAVMGSEESLNFIKQFLIHEGDDITTEATN
jgi:hypothetical protein